MVPALIFLAVEFHRAPIRYGHLTDPTQALPEDFGTWLLESCNALTPAKIQTTADGLDMPPQELQEAFLFFLRHTLLLPSADHYRVLGLSRDCNTESVKQHHSMLVRLFHPDRMPDTDEWGIALTARINAAYQVLRDTSKRRRYDRDLRPLPRGLGRKTDGRDFFQPRGEIERSTRRKSSHFGIPTRARPIVRWMLTGLAVAGGLYFILRDPAPTALRVNPHTYSREAPGPAFLKGRSEDSSSQEPQVHSDTDQIPTQGSAPTQSSNLQPDER